MIIKHIDNANKGSFVAFEESQQIGEMTYSKAGDDKIIIDHTEVHPEHKGKSIGKILLAKAVEHVRENNIKIIPLCPFVKSSFDKDVDIRDVLA